MEITEILEALGIDDLDQLDALGDTLAPIADAAVGTIFKLTPPIAKAFNALGDYQVDRQIATFKRFIDGGFTREEALTLLLNNQSNMKDILKSLQEIKIT
jgi:hypothetical protein